MGAEVVFVLLTPAVTLVFFGAVLVSDELTLVPPALLEPFLTAAVTDLGLETGLLVAGFFTVALGANLARLTTGSF